jgi:hypothetical protein
VLSPQLQQVAARPPQQITPTGFPRHHCGKIDHLAWDFSQVKQDNSSRAPAIVVNQQRSRRRGPTPRFGHANYTIVEEIPTGEEVLAGTFFLSGRPIVIPFDFGASHEFMSSICADKAKLSLATSRMQYVISTPGSRVDADRLVRRAPLDLVG